MKRLLTDKAKMATSTTSTETDYSRRIFSRVLNEGMQSWMKKTTYITNDYSRKVHDFKSLAKTKQEAEVNLEVRHQDVITHRRSAAAIAKTFEEGKQTVVTHPSKSNVHPVVEMEFLPDDYHWGYSYTHVVFDKAPADEDISKFGDSFIANVRQEDPSARMNCDLCVLSKEEKGDQDDDHEKGNKQGNTKSTTYHSIQQYDLDVVPLKEEDAPHINFCIWVNPVSKSALYVPMSSRVHLSNGKPTSVDQYKMYVDRRPVNEEDRIEIEERLMELEADGENTTRGDAVQGSRFKKHGTSSALTTDDDEDDSDQEVTFIRHSKPIVAEDG
jgi:hypothetical protein